MVISQLDYAASVRQFPGRFYDQAVEIKSGGTNNRDRRQPWPHILDLPSKTFPMGIRSMDDTNPYASPQSASLEPSPPPSSGISEITPGSEPIDVGACIKRGFELTKRNFGTLILVGLAYAGVVIVASILLNMIDSMLGLGQASQVELREGGFTVTGESGSVMNGIVSNVLSIFLSLGLCRIGLNLISGKLAAPSQLFGEGDKLLRSIGASILFGICVTIGLVLLIVPGIYVMLRYGQFMYAIVDRDMGVMESFEYSSSITTNNRVNIFLLGLAAIAVMDAGLLALVVGLVVAIPVIYLSWVVAYRWMQYGARAAMDEPGTSTPMLAAV